MAKDGTIAAVISSRSILNIGNGNLGIIISIDDGITWKEVTPRVKCLPTNKCLPSWSVDRNWKIREIFSFGPDKRCQNILNLPECGYHLIERIINLTDIYIDLVAVAVLIASKQLYTTFDSDGTYFSYYFLLWKNNCMEVLTIGIPF